MVSGQRGGKNDDGADGVVSIVGPRSMIRYEIYIYVCICVDQRKIFVRRKRRNNREVREEESVTCHQGKTEEKERKREREKERGEINVSKTETTFSTTFSKIWPVHSRRSLKIRNSTSPLSKARPLALFLALFATLGQSLLGKKRDASAAIALCAAKRCDRGKREKKQGRRGRREKRGGRGRHITSEQGKSKYLAGYEERRENWRETRADFLLLLKWSRNVRGLGLIRFVSPSSFEGKKKVSRREREGERERGRERERKKDGIKSSCSLSHSHGD